METLFLSGTYDPRLVTLSVAVAVFASFIALDLARRVHSAEPDAARYWLAGGSIAMGTGIWSMHFVAMLAYTLPIPLGYDFLITLLSWIAAVGVSGVALYIASRAKFVWSHTLAGAMAMGAGICLMHYTGMFAMKMVPAIQWSLPWLLISGLIAVGASFAALIIFFWMRGRGDRSRFVWQCAAATLMGMAVVGMHYSGMAAANFPIDSICGAASGLDRTWFAALTGGATMSLLAVTLVTSTLDARLQSRTSILASSLKQANTELQRIAFLDGLTRLPNRMLLADRLSHAIARAHRERVNMALLFIDLDGFKTINDTLGHQSGDQVLKTIGARLSGLARESDTVARIGGDEFVILVEVIDERTALSVLAQRIEQAVNLPIDLDHETVQLSASIGIAVFPEDADSDEQLLACADGAMYAAKAAGKGTFRFHDAATAASAAELMATLRDLRHAIDREEFELFYQPKLSSSGSVMLGVEALIRWRHPERGLVPPNVFIPVAERFGLIVAIGSWVIERACQQMRAWLDQGWSIPVAVNLAVQQLQSPRLVDEIESSLRRHRVDATQLTLEITESGAMNDAAQTLEILRRLETVGVKISIDDFGTGYSSLSYLRRFAVDELKIDGSFVQDIGSSEEARSIIAAVVELAHSLGLRVVAEGVETAQQKEFLATRFCDAVQGYLFSHPVPAKELEEKLASRHFTLTPDVNEDEGSTETSWSLAGKGPEDPEPAVRN